MSDPKLPTPQRNALADLIKLAKAGDEPAIVQVRDICEGCCKTMPIVRLIELANFMLVLGERTDRDDAETN